MTITNHGVQVSTVRQWTTALTPNAAGTGWNFISASWAGTVGEPIKWNIVKDFTTTPTFDTDDTATHHYPNSNFNIPNQVRTANGRIFFPGADNSLAYYDPTTETVTELPVFVEVPPVNPAASTALYIASLDTAGMLYFGTQESQNRPAMICRVDPVTLTQTVLGYVGDSAAGYTTYAFRIAVDTVTASKYIYVAYGQNPWQLWALNITTGVATKLSEVTATGNVSFANISGQGWIANIDTNLGQPDNVRTQLWCLDGATYPYTVGVPPPVTARNVTPASYPLTLPPQVDYSGGTGIVRWRPNGSTGAYTTVNYPVYNASPIGIESLVDYDDGVIGNTLSYNGFFQFEQPSTETWFGAYQTISRGPRLNIDGKIYAAGYPNGVLVRYDPALPWDGTTNPVLVGYYGTNGTQHAGIKYSDYMAWAPAAGAQGQLYVCGSRERNGVGSGIGAWRKATNNFIGTYAATGMVDVTPTGMCVLNSISRVVMAGRKIAGGDATLHVFDYDLNLIWTGVPIAGVSDLGQVWETATSGLICGVRQGSGNTLNIWTYNINTDTLVSNVNTAITGSLQPTQYRRPGTNKVYLVVGTNVVRVDVDALTAETVIDVSSIMPVDSLALAGDGVTLFMAGGVASGVQYANLYSERIDNVTAGDSFNVNFSFNSAIMSNNGSTNQVAEPFAASFVFGFADFIASGPTADRTGDKQIQMLNGEGSAVLFGQPVYASGELTFSLARADSAMASRVVGIAAARVEAGVYGPIANGQVLTGTRAQWDAVCGTTGGLVAGTVYYLSATTPGRLTSTPPLSGHVEPVILALSATMARVKIRPSTLL